MMASLHNELNRLYFFIVATLIAEELSNSS